MKENWLFASGRVAVAKIAEFKIKSVRVPVKVLLASLLFGFSVSLVITGCAAAAWSPPSERDPSC